MGQLIIHSKDGNLELDGFLLQVGDQIEMRLIDSWVRGQIAHDQGGWYFLTPNHVGIRLRTGLTARSLVIPPQLLSFPDAYSPFASD